MPLSHNITFGGTGIYAGLEITLLAYFLIDSDVNISVDLEFIQS